MDSPHRRRTFLRAGMALAPALLAPGFAQEQSDVPRDKIVPDNDPDARLPNGKKQIDVILKAEYQQNVRDSRELTALAKEIELDFDRNDQNVLSIGLLKKLDDMEKIARRIRARVKR